MNFLANPIIGERILSPQIKNKGKMSALITLTQYSAATSSQCNKA